MSSDFNVFMYRYTKNILIQFYVALHKIITHKETLCMQVFEKIRKSLEHRKTVQGGGADTIDTDRK